MALNAGVLAAALKPTLKTAHLECGAVDNEKLDKFCAALADAIAKAVVTHITSAAVVNVATTCGAGAGTGAGTIT